MKNTKAADRDLTRPIVKARGPIRLKKLASISFYNDRRTHTKCWEPIRSTKEEIIITSKLLDLKIYIELQ